MSVPPTLGVPVLAMVTSVDVPPPAEPGGPLPESSLLLEPQAPATNARTRTIAIAPRRTERLVCMVPPRIVTTSPFILTRSA